MPLTMLLPFLLGVLHRAGLMQWVKTEWVTYNFWKAAFIAYWTRWTTDAAASAATTKDKAEAEATKEERSCCDTGECTVRRFRFSVDVYTCQSISRARE